MNEFCCSENVFQVSWLWFEDARVLGIYVWSGDDYYSYIVYLKDIERQDRYAVLAAVAGVLVTLLHRAPEER